MESDMVQAKIGLPSFSLILETENLENADIEDLSRSLRSLVNQKVSPDRAQEVLLIDSGDAPPQLLSQLCDRYPWIKVYPAPAETGYYGAKMLGAELATGEIVVYCDSDCIYEPTWLGNLLTPLSQNPAIEVVAGETRTRGRGPYGTAMALTYIFPQYSGQTELTPTGQYFLNNVAFRREFLLRHPIPPQLPLYRGNCAIHAQNLVRSGYQIWRQPIARGTHAPPEGLAHFFWRFLLIGHDYYWQNRLMAAGDRAAFRESSFGGKVQTFFDRVGTLFADNPRHWFYLPLAVPIAAASIGLIFVGHSITRFRPHYLLRAYEQRGRA
jgi:GT2 family glycosyltransferase